MNAIKNFLTQNKIYSLLFCITLLIGLPPFIIYGSALHAGSIPTYDEWAHYGGNHGPWFFSPKADLILNTSLALLFLSGITFVVSIIISLRSNTGRFCMFAKGIVLALGQIFWAYLILRTMFWTID